MSANPEQSDRQIDLFQLKYTQHRMLGMVVSDRALGIAVMPAPAASCERYKASVRTEDALWIVITAGGAA
jgi:hypothetical protein